MAARTREASARWTFLLVVALIGALLQGSVPGADAVATNSIGYPWADFNGDGYGDFAVGAPGEAIGRRGGAGAVHVFYARSDGIVGRRSQLWHQDTRGVPGGAEAEDAFGSALAVGDFNDDGFDDLAIGSPGESIGSARGSGTVTVLYGRANGLQTSGVQLLRQQIEGIAGATEAGDNFGRALASGDFDNDGVTDLAVGAPGEDIGSIPDAGAVNILNGYSPGGLTGAGGELFYQGVDNFGGAPEPGDRFGFSLTSGNFDGDTYDDLAIGSPFESVDSHPHAGAVHVVYGAIAGPDGDSAHLMTQDTVFTTPQADAEDLFGYSLASGNFGPGQDLPDAYDDLAVGVPGDDPSRSGTVNIMYGSNEGFVEAATEWFQGKAGNTAAVPGARERGDNFGFAVHSNDFNGDGRADLAIGVPGEDNPRNNEGGVVVLYGSPDGLEPGVGPAQFITQESGGILAKGEDGDLFGAMLTSGDYDADGFADLVIGAPGEAIGKLRNAGAATVLYGRTGRISGAGSRLLHQNVKGVAGTAETRDEFGGSGA